MRHDPLHDWKIAYPPAVLEPPRGHRGRLGDHIAAGERAAIAFGAVSGVGVTLIYAGAQLAPIVITWWRG